MLRTLFGLFGLLAASRQAISPATTPGGTVLTVADTPSTAIAADGLYISWKEHRIDDEALSGGTPIRGGDGLAMADIDRDGIQDIASVHEDSNHLKIAFGTPDPDRWISITVGQGSGVAAIEDVAIGDINGDGDIDFVATRGNSGRFAGVFWLERVRTAEPRATFTPARAKESRALPLPPPNWMDIYDESSTFIPPIYARSR